MWEFFEKLLAELPTRDEISTTVGGAIQRALHSFKPQVEQTAGQPITPTPVEAAAEAPAESQIQRDERSLSESREKLNRIQEMLANLGRSVDETTSQPDSPAHVIVDNPEDLKPEVKPSELSKPEVPKNGNEVLKFLESLQSPEWHSKTDAEKRVAFEQKFGGPPEMVNFVEQFPKDQQPTAKSAWWRKTINRRLAEMNKPQRPAEPVVTQQPAPSRSMWRRRFKSVGRRMQMWAGRMTGMGGGGRVVGMAARGLSRAGMMVEGIGAMGAAGTVGAGFSALALSIPAAVAAVVAFVKGTRSAGESLLEQQQRLAGFSGTQSQAMGITTLNKLQNDIRTAEGTGLQTLALAKEMNELRDSMQPIENLATNLELMVVRKLVDASTNIVNAANALGEPIMKILEEAVKFQAWAQGGEAGKNQQFRDFAAFGARVGLGAAFGLNNQQPPAIPMEQILRDMRDAAKGQPAKGRPPLNPIN